VSHLPPIYSFKRTHYLASSNIIVIVSVAYTMDNITNQREIQREWCHLSYVVDNCCEHDTLCTQAAYNHPTILGCKKKIEPDYLTDGFTKKGTMKNECQHLRCTKIALNSKIDKLPSSSPLLCMDVSFF
jgi:hypothetical protein